jgi:hypothetical protein
MQIVGGRPSVDYRQHLLNVITTPSTPELPIHGDRLHEDVNGRITIQQSE